MYKFHLFLFSVGIAIMMLKTCSKIRCFPHLIFIDVILKYKPQQDIDFTSIEQKVFCPNLLFEF